MGVIRKMSLNVHTKTHCLCSQPRTHLVFHPKIRADHVDQVFPTIFVHVDHFLAPAVSKSCHLHYQGGITIIAPLLLLETGWKIN